METIQLENFAKDLFNVNIKMLLQTIPGKWYESKYKEIDGQIELDTIYGISMDGSIDFDFKTGKKEDTILKTFVTQYINKYECKRMIIKDGKFCYPNKKDIIAKLKNSNRVNKYYFYTTLYGIGYFVFFMGETTFEDTNKKVSKYLRNKGIEFSNEFSDAGWVYRFVINKDIETHNKLLEEFTF